MTYLFNDTRRFRHEFLVGLSAAHPDTLRPVPGGAGVVSVTAPAPGEVGVVIGGGSGHYPAFAGLVGPGLCDGAVVGEIFTSPSARAVLDLIEATDSGAGVLLSFGNYSGDVMHFGLAAQQARQAGRDVRIVLVTDDVASAPVDEVDRRRGVAGGFYVFRAAAAAARAGHTLDEVEAVARHANDRVRTFGVAFGGCTFPGADAPLFTVPDEGVALGLGIHGEPGIESRDRMSADATASEMLTRLLAERPADGQRARVLVNGLGAVKYEELFVLTSALVQSLQDHGIEVVDTQVGEYVTSLDMAGCSVSICWTTPELDLLLDTPARAPGLVHTGGAPTPAPDVRLIDAELQPRLPVRSGAVERRTDLDEAAVAAVAALTRARDAVLDTVDELGRLDSVAGDGDHGLGMSRGLTAAVAAAELAGPALPDVLEAAGMAFADVGGGASGALWGAGLCALAHAVRDRLEPGVAAQAAVIAVAQLGGARLGDKTVVDAATPFVNALADALDAGSSLAASWEQAVHRADEAALATRDLASRRGRAAVHSDHSIGHPDPGCVSFVTVVRAAGDVLAPSKAEGIR